MTNVNHYLTPLFMFAILLLYIVLGVATTLLWDSYFESK